MIYSLIFCIILYSSYLKLNMEAYRSGHNGPDSKFSSRLSVSSAENPLFARTFTVRKLKYFAVLSVSSFQSDFEFQKSLGNTADEYTRKRIEVVITGLTRNQLYLTVPWVRIPPLPPSGFRISPVFMRFFHTLISFTVGTKFLPFCYFRTIVITIFKITRQ